MPAVMFPLLGVMTAREVGPVYMRDLVMLFVGAVIILVIHKASVMAYLLNLMKSKQKLSHAKSTTFAWINYVLV